MLFAFPNVTWGGYDLHVDELFEQDEDAAERDGLDQADRVDIVKDFLEQDVQLVL